MGRGPARAGTIRIARHDPVRPLSPPSSTPLLHTAIFRYLQNGNILAATTFITHFTSHLLQARPNLERPGAEALIRPTADSLVNFAQLAVCACQRAQGETRREPREAWIRLCGTYQSRGSVLVEPAVRRALIEIGELFFALPPPRMQPANPMAEMMSSLFGVGGGGGGGGAPQTRRVLQPVIANEGLD